MKRCRVLGRALPENNGGPLSFVCLTPPLPKRHPERSLTDGDPACVRKHINQRGPFARRGVSGPPPCFPRLTLSRLHLRMRLSGGRRGTGKMAEEGAGALQASLAEPPWRPGRSSRLPGAHFSGERLRFPLSFFIHFTSRQLSPFFTAGISSVLRASQERRWLGAMHELKPPLARQHTPHFPVCLPSCSRCLRRESGEEEWHFKQLLRRALPAPLCCRLISCRTPGGDAFRLHDLTHQCTDPCQLLRPRSADRGRSANRSN